MVRAFVMILSGLVLLCLPRVVMMLLSLMLLLVSIPLPAVGVDDIDVDGVSAGVDDVDVDDVDVNVDVDVGVDDVDDVDVDVDVSALQPLDEASLLALLLSAACHFLTYVRALSSSAVRLCVRSLPRVTGGAQSLLSFAYACHCRVKNAGMGPC